MSSDENTNIHLISLCVLRESLWVTAGLANHELTRGANGVVCAFSLLLSLLTLGCSQDVGK